MKLFLFIFTLTSILISSQEGFEYATTGNNIDYYVKIEQDVDNNLGVYSKFWLKYDNPAKRIKLKSGKYATKAGGYTLANMTIFCAGKSHKTHNIINYDKNGNVIRRDDTPIFDRPIVPGSVIEGIYRKVCRRD